MRVCVVHDASYYSYVCERYPWRDWEGDKLRLHGLAYVMIPCVLGAAVASIPTEEGTNNSTGAIGHADHCDPEGPSVVTGLAGALGDSQAEYALPAPKTKTHCLEDGG